MLQEFIDYYKILGVPRNVTCEEVATVRRALARRWHPDHAPAERIWECTKMLADINVAADCLSDPKTRTKYDKAYPRAGLAADACTFCAGVGSVTKVLSWNRKSTPVRCSNCLGTGKVYN